MVQARGTRSTRSTRGPGVQAVLLAVALTAAVPWVAGPEVSTQAVASWTQWATGQGSDVPEQTYGSAPEDSSIAGSDLSQRFRPPGRPVPPQRPLVPQRPQRERPIVTYGTPPPSVRATPPSTVALAETVPTPLTTPSVFPRTQVCLPLYGPSARVPLDVKTERGTGTTNDTAVLTWWHNGDLGAIAYWVGVRGGLGAAGGAIRWTHLTPPSGCHPVVFKLTGLTRGTPYTLTLDLQSRTPETIAGWTRHTLNQVPWSSCPDTGTSIACV